MKTKGTLIGRFIIGSAAGGSGQSGGGGSDAGEWAGGEGPCDECHRDWWCGVLLCGQQVAFVLGDGQCLCF